MTLYSELVRAGIEVSNRNSDLYFPVTPESTRILNEHPKVFYSIFTNQITKEHWYEAPFEYIPWWEKR